MTEVTKDQQASQGTAGSMDQMNEKERMRFIFGKDLLTWITAVAISVAIGLVYVNSATRDLGIEVERLKAKVSQVEKTSAASIDLAVKNKEKLNALGSALD